MIINNKYLFNSGDSCLLLLFRFLFCCIRW